MSASGIQVLAGRRFFLQSSHFTFAFHVANDGTLVQDHFGAKISSEKLPERRPAGKHGSILYSERRIFSDSGRGDLRLPAIHILHAAGHSVTAFKYSDYEIIDGKPVSIGMPSVGLNLDPLGRIQTLMIHLIDEPSSLRAVLRFTVFADVGVGAIVRSFSIINDGHDSVQLQRAASFDLDLPSGDLDMIQLDGNWAREGHSTRRKVSTGTQGFHSLGGYSSPLHNPFVAVCHSSTNETHGDVWGFNLVYTGSHECTVESTGFGTRIQIGLNSLRLSWTISAGSTFDSPECVAVYSSRGIGDMSRTFHRLYRTQLSKSQYTSQCRPALLNTWEGCYFDFNQNSILEMAYKTSELGLDLIVVDDGWFGEKYPRVDDDAGLGDWIPNPERFPEGLRSVVDKINACGLKFGIWVEPEMVNKRSALYEAHPEWVLHACDHPRTETRNQLVLDLSLMEVQDYLISSLSDLLDSANIEYIKWDNNRYMHEMATPATNHAYILGLYRVLEILTTRYPAVLWEGCASGGGRFDAGLLRYFPQTWASDNSDALDRISIQWGTALVYPASSIGAHVSAVPNHWTGSSYSLDFRADVALMGGGFGFELDPTKLSKQDAAHIAKIVTIHRRVQPFVITGDLFRLTDCDNNWPAALYIAEDGSAGVLFSFQIKHIAEAAPFPVRFQGLEVTAKYEVEGFGVFHGDTLMTLGINIEWQHACQSRIVFFTRL